MTRHWSSLMQSRITKTTGSVPSRGATWFFTISVESSGRLEPAPFTQRG